MVYPRRLFVVSCLALITTAMVFSIRSDILDAIGKDFRLNREQIGIILSPAFWGFTVSIMVGGALVDYFGMRRLLLLSAAGYITSVCAIIFAPRPTLSGGGAFFAQPGFISLYAGMLLLGLSQGLVEGVINPLCATLFPHDKARRFTILHSWYPGGLITGGILAFMITKAMGLDGAPSAAQATLGWKLKLGLILIPTVAFAGLCFGQQFPETERVTAGISAREMVTSMKTPMFMIWFVLMWLTCSTEQGPGQWIGSVITNLTGMQGILVLVYTAGIVFLLRFFGGGLVHKFSPVGLLAMASVLAALGVYGLGASTTTWMVFLSATLFGAGTSFFAPVMLSTTSEQFPKTGALGLAVIGGTGQIAVSIVLPLMGHWYDQRGPAATFEYMAALPCILAIAFSILFLRYRRSGGYKPVSLAQTLTASVPPLPSLE